MTEHCRQCDKDIIYKRFGALSKFFCSDKCENLFIAWLKHKPKDRQ